MRGTLLFVVLALALAAPATGRAVTTAEKRKTTNRDLAVEVHRVELPGGLTLLLAPDPGASSVLVWTAFRAGAAHEPPGRSGLAHLVEHLLFSGPTEETDYLALLQSRRARQVNAATGVDAMTFQVTLPPEELAVAFWVAAERLSTLPGLIDDPLVERHRQVVVQERAERNLDAPYGLVGEELFHRLYPASHPLHGGVIGVPSELAAVTAAEVRAFVAERLVPANAVVTVVGRFNPAEAQRLAEATLGRLPPGRRAPPPTFPALADTPTTVERPEPLAREPRVTLAWRLQGMPYADAMALRLGAQMLSFLVDGAWGMRVSAGVSVLDGEALFRMDLVVPYDEPSRNVLDDADGFLRQLTRKEMPWEHAVAANLALDRVALFQLDSLPGRAGLLQQIELAYGPRLSAERFLSVHWDLDRAIVRDSARTLLKGPRLVLHARPTRPRPARVERE